MSERMQWMGLGAAVGVVSLSAVVWLPAAGESAQGGDSRNRVQGWKKGTGWGWIWGKQDEVGSLNAMTPATKQSALRLAKQGQVYDMGITYSHNSFKWPGHNPCEVMTFRSPESIKRQLDHDFIKPSENKKGQAWHSCAVFISDNVATQIDSLGHITAGADNHWYNNFREADWGGNFGIRKCDATTIPPIVARGVMLDIASLKGVDVLPPHYGITPGDVDRAVENQKVELRPGDVVLFRTGTLRYWGKDGSDAETIGQYDTAGITLQTAKYLVEQFGAMMIGSDTSGVEVAPAPEESGTFIPVHNYLLVEQGVHIAEFHYLEDLARDKVYEFCYIAATNKIAGTTAGFTMRPIAIR